MANFNLTITDEGAAFLANIIANSGNINFSEVRFSSNNYVGSESSLTAGTWGGTFITATPSASVVDNTTINVEASFNNSSFTTDKSLYSIGVIGNDGNGTTALIAVATTSTPEIISQFILNASTYAYDINLSVSSTASITVTASTAGVLYVSDIIDNLASSNTNKPLSAKQGKALQDAKQPKELSSAITIGGVSQTTVEGALGALNKSKTERTEISNVEATTTATDNYASGDYIYIESLGGIYKAITAITSGQPMTPGSNLSSNPVTVGEELAALNSNKADLSMFALAKYNCNDATTPGQMFFIPNDGTNKPGGWGGNVINAGSLACMLQYFVENNTNKVYVRVYVNSVWGSWTEIPYQHKTLDTALTIEGTSQTTVEGALGGLNDKITPHYGVFTPNTGYNLTIGTNVYKSSDIVVWNMAWNANITTVNQYVEVGTLPEGFRPKTEIYASLISISGTTVTGSACMYIQTNGKVYVNVTNSGTWIAGTVAFRSA